jgi:flagellar protein FliO/FliZ
MSSPRVVLVIALLAGIVLFGTSALGVADGAAALPGARLVRIVLGTLVAVGLLLLTARILPRLGGVRGIASDAFRVVASLPVGQRERVVVVQVGKQQIMLGVAPGRVDVVHELAEPLPERTNVAAIGTGLPAQNWISRVVGSGS